MNHATDPHRRRLVMASFGLAVVALARGVRGADPPSRVWPYEFGVVPYLPTARLLTVFEPLRAHLAAALQHPVALSTAPDFKSFQRRVLDGLYDLYFIGPGPGWQAHRDRQHLILAAAQARLKIFLLVRKAGPISRIADLRGKTVASIDPLTVTAQVIAAVLKENGLGPGIDVMLRTERTPFNAAQAVALGEAAAAACPDVAYPDFPAELRDQLHILYRSEDLPGGLVMARPTSELPAPAVIQKALLDFSDSVAGRVFGKESGQAGFVLPDPRMLAPLERFLPETRRVMSEP